MRDDDGVKMSKSKNNYPDVNEVFDRDSSDAMRWFLMASPILRGGDLVVTERGIRDAVRQARAWLDGRSEDDPEDSDRRRGGEEER